MASLASGKSGGRGKRGPELEACVAMFRAGRTKEEVKAYLATTSLSASAKSQKIKLSEHIVQAGTIPSSKFLSGLEYKIARGHCHLYFAKGMLWRKFSENAFDSKISKLWTSD